MPGENCHGYFPTSDTHPPPEEVDATPGAHPVGDMSATKASAVPSWHQNTIEKRILKRHRLGPADVYPQENKQEEDSLAPERLKKGFLVGNLLQIAL